MQDIFLINYQANRNNTMNRRLKNQIIESYGKQWIDKAVYHERQGFHYRYQEKFVECLLKENAVSVLECGAGTGTMMKKVSANVFKVKSPKAAFYTIDNSVSLIRYLKKNEHKLSQVPIKQVNASVDALPFQDNFFDVVYSVSVLWYVENVIRAIDEMYRVLKPGGIMCFDVMSILNPTGFLGTISNFLTKNIVLKYSMNYVIPAAIERHVKKLGGSYESYGFMPILPTALPVVGDRLNVYMWLNWLPEVKNSLIKNVCNKVIYKVKKPDNNEKRP